MGQIPCSTERISCYHMRCTHVREKTEYNKRIKTRSFWAPESESASTSKCMTPTLGTRPVSSVGLATNWRLSTVDNHTSWFELRPSEISVVYGRLFMCFSSCIFHSCIFHSRIFSAPCRLLIHFMLSIEHVVEPEIAPLDIGLTRTRTKDLSATARPFALS